MRKVTEEIERRQRGEACHRRARQNVETMAKKH
jgi:hypothetical protein